MEIHAVHMNLQMKPIKYLYPFVPETWIFQENWVDIIHQQLWYWPCRINGSCGIFHEEGFQLSLSSHCQDIKENENAFMLAQNQPARSFRPLHLRALQEIILEFSSYVCFYRHVWPAKWACMPKDLSISDKTIWLRSRKVLNPGVWIYNSWNSTDISVKLIISLNTFSFNPSGHTTQ